MENTANLSLVIKRKFHVNFCSVVLFGCVWQRLQIYRNDTSESRLCVKNRIVFSPTTKFSVCLCLMCVESVYKIYVQKIRQTTTSTPEKHAPKFRLPRILWTKFWIDNGEALVCGAIFPFIMPVRQTITMQSNGKYCNGKNVKCYFGFWYKMCEIFGAKIWMWQRQPKEIVCTIRACEEGKKVA